MTEAAAIVMHAAKKKKKKKKSVIAMRCDRSGDQAVKKELRHGRHLGQRLVEGVNEL